MHGLTHAYLILCTLTHRYYMFITPKTLFTTGDYSQLETIADWIPKCALFQFTRELSINGEDLQAGPPLRDHPSYTLDLDPLAIKHLDIRLYIFLLVAIIACYNSLRLG